MGLKNRLLAIGLAATALAGGMSEAKNTEAPTRQPQAAKQDVSKNQMTQEQYQHHVQKIHGNISGTWGSFGDESLLQESFLKIAATPFGRQTIPDVSENIVIKSERMDGDAYYVFEDKSITIKSALIGSDESNKQTIFTLLAHELLHVKQATRGLRLNDKGTSPFQMMVSEKVREAEARAWDFMNSLTYELDKEGLDKSILKNKKTVDLLSAHILSNTNDSDRKMKVHTLEALHKNYLRTNDFDKVVNRTVGQMITEYVQGKLSQKDPGWYDKYDVQAVNNMMINAKKGSISQKGNAAAYRVFLDYYAKEYGLKPSDIEEAKLSGRAGVLLQKAEQVIKTVPPAGQKEQFEALFTESSKLYRGELKNALPNPALNKQANR